MKPKRNILGPFKDNGVEYYEIELTQGLTSKISPEDINKVKNYNWCASRESRNTKWYAIRWTMKNRKQIKIRLHRFIFDNIPSDKVINHINDDGLDNRRLNLEIIDQSENMDKVPNWKRRY